jgi:predicted ATPase
MDLHKRVIPQNLINAVKSKSLIPLVGAGVSMSIQDTSHKRVFPSWKELLERAATRISEQGNIEVAEGIKSMLRLNRYQTAAELARDGLVGRLWVNFFNENFLVRNEKILPESLALPKAVWTLSNRVITLNYDKVLRLAAPDPANVIELDNSSITQLADFNGVESSFPRLWHLHGRIDSPQHIIFTEESYISLYSSNKHEAALDVLRSTCREKTLLFVGCSLDDADLLQQISNTHTLFAEHTGPHYALVRNQDRAAIQSKLNHLPIILVGFEDYGAPLLDLVLEISRGNDNDTKNNEKIIQQETQEEPAQLKLQAKEVTRIAVLISQPIDKDFDYSEYLKEIRKIKCEISYFPLSLGNLQEIEEYDYIFILTKSSRKRLFIEEETLEARRITLKELEANIGQAPKKAVILLLDHAKQSDLDADDIASITTPMLIYPKLDRKALEIFNFKVFKKSEFSYAEQTTALNMGDIRFEEPRPSYKENFRRTKLPDEIDLKSAKNFVGRTTDLVNLSRKIIELRHKNEFLTIKGSGGIGKTQTIKRLAIALAERNFFPEGITFIDCEFIEDLEVFERSIAQLYGLEDASDIRKQLREVGERKDALIILDNVETLLHLKNASAFKSFLNFMCDYGTFVITSRELLSLECEDIYELRQLTSEEATSLFFQTLGVSEVNIESRDYVRTQVVELLLDNNPLAIKLIARNIPKGKSFTSLKTELEEDIFRVSETDIEVFGSESDVNIERKRSLFASINYSYHSLTQKEKTAFEVLSLFPDGINLENLKRVSASAAKIDDRKQVNLALGLGPITDLVIKALENKSMIQVDNRMVKLQSIVGKFASKQLQSRPFDEIKRYCRSALEYCYSFARHISRIYQEDQYQGRRITNAQQANFIKSIEYVDPTEIGSERFLDYLETLNAMFVSVCIGNVLLHALRKREDAIFPNESARLCFDVLALSLEYYGGNFDEAYAKLQQSAPLDILMTLSTTDVTQSIIAKRMEDIYGMEGEALWAARSEIRKNSFTGFYSHSLLHLGVLEPDLLTVCRIDFFTLEAMYAMGVLSVEFAEAYVDSIHEKGHLEIMQSHYVLSKLRRVSANKVSKLVVVNPYTEGLKNLMQAFVERDLSKKKFFFEQACEALYHIKYYYVECMYFYAKFLKEEIPHLFRTTYDLAVTLADKYNYRYLLHLLKSLETEATQPYNANLYKLEFDEEFRKYIKLIIKENRPIKKMAIRSAITKS